MKRETLGNLIGYNDIPCYTNLCGGLEDMPKSETNTIHIVSSLVRTHKDNITRRDVASPGNLLRDDDGNVVGCNGLDFNY